VRVFLDKGEALLSLLRVIAASSHAPAYAGTLLAAAGEVTHDDGLLSGRELQVLELIVKGNSNKEIGDALSISEATVKWHVNMILSRLNVSDRTQATVAALQRGIVHLP